MLTFGSSVTEGSHGHFFSSREAVFGTGARALSKSDSESCKSPGACDLPGSVRDLMVAINASWPHVNHTLINLGVAGADLVYFLDTCVGNTLPHTADLLIFQNHKDNATCSGDQECAGVRGLAIIEKLHHRLEEMLSPSHSQRNTPSHAEQSLPLVLMSYLWVTDPLNDNTSWTVGNNRRACGKSAWEHRMESSLRAAAVEDSFAPLSAFYGWSSISLRNALFASLRDGALERLNVTECEFASILLGDQIHPSMAGMRFMGDALIELLHAAVAVYEPRVVTELTRRPRSPFIPDAWTFRRTSCTEAVHFHIVSENGRGWAFVAGEDVLDHATNTTRFVPKPGLLAHDEGATVTLALKTRLMGTNKDSPVELLVFYLTSYEKMGDAVMTCMHGCSCKSTRLNGTVSELISVESHVSVNVTQSMHCNIQFVTERTVKGSKFKLLRMTVQEIK